MRTAYGALLASQLGFSANLTREDQVWCGPFICVSHRNPALGKHVALVTHFLSISCVILHPNSKTRHEYHCQQQQQQHQCASGSVNQIPPHARVSGDCRVTPFYGIAAVVKSIEGYVTEINADPTILPSRGAFSKYVLPAEDRKGTLELTWMTGAADGIACNLTSEGALALNSATAKVRIKL